MLCEQRCPFETAAASHSVTLFYLSISCCQVKLVQDVNWSSDAHKRILEKSNCFTSENNYLNLSLHYVESRVRVIWSYFIVLVRRKDCTASMPPMIAFHKDVCNDVGKPVISWWSCETNTWRMLFTVAVNGTRQPCWYERLFSCGMIWITWTRSDEQWASCLRCSKGNILSSCQLLI